MLAGLPRLGQDPLLWRTLARYCITGSGGFSPLRSRGGEEVARALLPTIGRLPSAADFLLPRLHANALRMVLPTPYGISNPFDAPPTPSLSLSSPLIVLLH